ncbi:ribonuclease catalytic domain-containing protein [Prochlorococcus sp. MIT 0601]|uniref:ribonuclease catalytic domain-containing protein n=1 Tax=Prochlorococcus sp. MIT 0601 TaxID=1499498 RepID=UPI0005338153|nr:ribonuclease catalytic domain-containing protein [Prochlorococcus sp. MIT 0601]KGG12425.1 Exoribonuclease II [Prochlorococcus sp. MIT 0601]
MKLQVTDSPVAMKQKNSNESLVEQIKDIKNKSLEQIDYSLKDLTSLKTYTIDDIRSKEIDDAISLEYLDNSYRLWVHITSPCEYFDIASQLDVYAEERAASTYLATETIYMMPYEIISDLFSLKKDRISYAISVFADLNSDGSINNSGIFRTIIKPSLKLSYDDADEILDIQPKEELALVKFKEILKRRRNWRLRNGAIIIEEPQGKFILEGEKITHEIIEPTESRKLISESMILFGTIIAKYCRSNNISIPFRVQGGINKNNDSYYTGNNKHVINFITKQTLSKSYISSIAEKHHSLGLDEYVQATSPLRRYIDIIVHFQLINDLKSTKLMNQDIINNKINNYTVKNRQIIQRVRDNNRTIANKWFLNNNKICWAAIFLRWLHKPLNIALIYFSELEIDIACKLDGCQNAVLGTKLELKCSSSELKSDKISFEALKVLG